MKPATKSWASAIVLVAGVVTGVVATRALVPARAPVPDASASSPAASPSERGSAGLGGSVPMPGGAPFFHATEFSTLADADAASVADLRSVPRPADALASDTVIDTVWVQTDDSQPQIAISYSTGIAVGLETALPSYLDDRSARAAYQAMAKEDSYSTQGRAYVTDVAGVPAYLIPDGAAVWANGESQGGPGFITFQTGGWQVTIEGHVGVAELLRLASSVLQNVPR